MSEEIVKSVLPVLEETPRDDAPQSPAPSDSMLLPAESIADLFGMKGSLTSKQVQWLNEVSEWAKDQAKDPEDLKWAIVQKKNSLGAPHLGTTQLEHFMQWLKAFKGVQRANNALRAAEGL
jgi:hypothetical protein